MYNTGVTILKCRGCLEEHPREFFPLRADKSGDVRRPYCPTCINSINRSRYKAYKRTSPFKHRLVRARTRAKHLGLPFDLDENYLKEIWTGVCPALGIVIDIALAGREDDQAAELDRIVPSKGYIKGNVVFLSRRANRIKNDARPEELRSIANWLESL